MKRGPTAKEGVVWASHSVPYCNVSPLGVRLRWAVYSSTGEAGGGGGLRENKQMVFSEECPSGVWNLQIRGRLQHKVENKMVS